LMMGADCRALGASQSFLKFFGETVNIHSFSLPLG
jgi:hypothetical protein